MRFLFRCLMLLLAVAQLAALATAFERAAYAYADPGSGLLFLQVAGSMVAGTLFVVRSKLRKLFRLGKGHVEEPEPEHSQDIEQ